MMTAVALTSGCAPTPHASPSDVGASTDAGGDAPSDAASDVVEASIPVALTPLSAKPLVGLPDAFEPSGINVGKRTKDGCDGWDVATGGYRGEVARAVCDGWMGEIGHAAGQRIRIEGAAVVVERDGGGVVARLHGCYTSPKAIAISPSCARVVALCNASLLTWPATGGEPRELGIDKLTDRATLAFAAEDVAYAVVDDPDEASPGCDGRTVVDTCMRFHVVHFDLSRGTVDDREVGIARLDPFGHVLFRAEGFCGEDHCSADVSVDALRLQTVRLAWIVEGTKDVRTSLPLAQRFSDDGSTCLVRSQYLDGNRTRLLDGFTAISKSGARPLPITGMRPVIAPSGKRIASLVTPRFGGDLQRLEVATFGDDGGPPTRKEFPISAETPRRIVFSADAAYVAVELAKRVTLYDAASGNVVLFWEGVSSVVFDRARPDRIYAQKGDRVVARAIVTAHGAASPTPSLEGRMLRGSSSGNHPFFLSQHGMTVAYDGGGTEIGRWPVTGEEVVFGASDLSAIIGKEGVFVVALGRSGDIQWKLDPKDGGDGSRARFVARELWLTPAKGQGTRYDGVSGTKMGPTALIDSAEPSPDGTWSCGDGFVRRGDGATLQIVSGVAITSSGVHLGTGAGADAVVLQRGADLDAPLIRSGALPEREGLVGDFLLGAAIAAPTLREIPRIDRLSTSVHDGARDLWFVANGVTKLYSGGVLFAQVAPGAPGEIKHLRLLHDESVVAETCIDDVCSEKRAPLEESDRGAPALGH
ncbi:hypothetical protein BH09MYX1_BH09MYX1_19390 [soil metagenome]